jgi:GST-like protein
MSRVFDPRTTAWTLYAAKGGGSMIVEVALEIAGVPYEVVDVPWGDMGPGSKAITPLNPLGQVPTVVLPDGSVMTESAAIVLFLADLVPDAKLVPPPGDPERAAFLRWLAFLVAAVYPTFTYGDGPKRWLDGDEEMGKRLRASTDAHRENLLRYLEEHVAREPWFLGATFSALDLYLWVVSIWRPGRKWWEANTPKMHRIVREVAKMPAALKVKERNRS